jgi:hypothetical protein
MAILTLSHRYYLTVTLTAVETTKLSNAGDLKLRVSRLDVSRYKSESTQISTRRAIPMRWVIVCAGWGLGCSVHPDPPFARTRAYHSQREQEHPHQGLKRAAKATPGRLPHTTNAFPSVADPSVLAVCEPTKHIAELWSRGGL